MAPQEIENNVEIIIIDRQTRAQRLKKALKQTLNFGLIFHLALHFVMIIIAAINFHECTVEPQIPLFLLLEGVSGIIGKLVGLFRNWIHKYCAVPSILSFLATTNLLLFIIGSFYVYKVYEPNYDPHNGMKYCNKTVYLFSFIYITFTYVIIILLVIGLCCLISGILAVEQCIKDMDLDEDVEKEATHLPVVTTSSEPAKTTTQQL